jgi:chromosomal replication initiation ATPase DnaA
VTDQIALPLEYPSRTALGRGDFFVSDANALAVAMLDGWHSWPGRKMALVGPEGSGKTHLAHVWAAETGGKLVHASRLTKDMVPELASGHVCVEDLEHLFGHDARQDALFHLHNLTIAEGHCLLVTARSVPARWPITLPDLASRMQGTQVAKLGDPDDRLLSAVMAKLFFDRQLVPGPGVIAYIERRMPRSFAMAREVVEALDAAALAQNKGISRDLAREVLRGLLDDDG